MSAAQLSEMTERDLDEVVRIAESAFAPPWTRDGFEDELARTVARCRVARDSPGGPVLAYTIWWVIAGEQQLLTIASAPAARRRGLARALLDEMIAEGEAQGVTECFLEVRPSNTAAITLYRALGFEHVDARVGYYDDGESAAVMVRRY
ncbi:MAG: ribosomal protein S18-alanine N-acetyltransferase [Myxococcota bacterium]|nr:ribosomal protein S18-alanine N-acetyltransferase [Myxococcota bacterium]